MSEELSDKLGRVDIELALRIDAVCRRFEADRRAGKLLPIAGYLEDVPEEGRTASRQSSRTSSAELRTNR